MRALVIALTLLLVPQTSIAGNSGWRTLAGLKGVVVDVEVRGELQKSLSVSTVRTDVELALRVAGIAVQRGDEGKDEPEVGRLSVIVIGGPYPGELGLFLWSAEVELQQPVTLTRDPSINAVVPTWSYGSFGKGDVAQIRSGVRDYVDSFANAFLGANPPTK